MRSFCFFGSCIKHDVHGCQIFVCPRSSVFCPRLSSHYSCQQQIPTKSSFSTLIKFQDARGIQGSLSYLRPYWLCVLLFFVLLQFHGMVMAISHSVAHFKVQPALCPVSLRSERRRIWSPDSRPSEVTTDLQRNDMKAAAPLP